MNILLKVGGTIISLVAGLAGAKVVDAVWTKVTGNEPPKPTNPKTQAEATLRQALGFAVMSSVVAAVIQVATNRGTQRAIARFNRTLDEV
ncbi:DUF4235 domain-containing protein [Arthrobacter sp. KK5.5]|uniref:DUF4235 domain-containing protein n=1 Tax=Arthrobacter sp. KK5.5 TaxID=3373084 RepID=UPI003EE54795